jgi:hypothetical protein
MSPTRPPRPGLRAPKLGVRLEESDDVDRRRAEKIMVPSQNERLREQREEFVRRHIAAENANDSCRRLPSVSRCLQRCAEVPSRVEFDDVAVLHRVPTSDLLPLEAGFAPHACVPQGAHDVLVD